MNISKRYRQQFQQHRIGLAALLLGTVLLAACTRPTKVDSEWPQGIPLDVRFNKVLVVGVSPAYNTRCRFERMMQDSLKAPGATVTTSCSRMSSKDPLTRDAIVAIVRETGAEAVLTTRLVDGSAGLEEGGTDESRGEAYYKPIGYGYDPYYGDFGLPVVYADFVAEPPALTLRRTVVVSSNLYRASDAALVYTLDTTTYDKESQFDVIDEITTAIAGRMRSDGLLP